MRSHWQRGRRPPWWPEGEPWPPARWHGGPSASATRGRLFARLGCLLVAFLVPLGALFVLLGWSLATVVSGTAPPGPLPLVAVISLAALLLGVTSATLVGRALQRTAYPLADLMRAAERVAEGDYSTRVAEQGPPGVRSLVRSFNAMSARLQASDEQRRNLLADVTHELRTPVTVIQGNLEALLDGVYPADEAHLTTILDETHQLARLIDDLRTLALAESGALRLQREPTDAEVLVGETVASFRAQADEAGINLTPDIDPATPLLFIDPARIREVLGNLIGNALRHCPAGGRVTIRCRSGADTVAFEVEDTGVGIAVEELPRIFDRFHRARDSGGMGLGLAIARNLVVAHGGDISIESTVGKGTTVRFTLPVVKSG